MTQKGISRDKSTVVQTVPLICSFVSMLLCFFAGGKAYDIVVKFGILHLSVFESTDYIVNAVNGTESIEIKFPTDHEEQRLAR